MISDEDLKWFAGALNSAGVGEMATELLQLREEKRQAEEARAKSWEGAPEWANYRTTDASYWHETEPVPLESIGQWKKGGVGTKRVERIKSGWAQTLETRP